MEFCKSDKVFIICILVAICLLAAAVPLFAFHVIETDIARNSTHTNAEVIATGTRGIQISYTGNYGEPETATIRTEDDFAVGDTVQITLFHGRVDLAGNTQ